MATRKNVLTAFLATVLAIGLAACGSSSTTPAPDLGPAQTAAMDAAAAAKMASDDAAQAVAGVEASQDADIPSFIHAQIAEKDAQAASDAAKAASDAAQMASTLAEAEAQRDVAQAQQAHAEAALAEAMRFAGMVAAAQQALDDMATEAAALMAAQTAASTAAGEAAKAASDAAMAVAAVEMGKDDDAASYASAQAAATAAMNASNAAKDASDAAQMAATSAEAQAHQATAEAQQSAAASALADATMYAGMVTSAHNEATALATAKTAAMDAATAARAAATAARAAADKVAELEPGSQAAMDAAAAADAAHDAAVLAEDASARAQMATSSGDAQSEQSNAEAHLATAMSGQTTAKGLEMTAQAKVDEETARATAKSAASTAADAARKAATAARTAANMVAALLGADSTHAVDADKAAKAAEDAATAAETANTSAQSATTSADAMTHQATAETKQGEAEGQLATAKGLQDEAQVIADGIERDKELQAIAEAQEAAKTAKDAAAKAHTDAVTAAGKARTAATNARAEADRAALARTDATNAAAEAMKAEKAADDADDAVAKALAAKDAANTAYMDAMAATTSAGDDGAKAHQMTAEAEQKKAEAAHMGVKDDAGMVTTKGAMQHESDAKMAETAAMKAANTHVLALFEAANAYDIMEQPAVPDDPTTTDKDESMTADEATAKARADEVASVGMAIMAAAADQMNKAASAMWMGNTPDDPATVDDPTTDAVENDETMMRDLTVTVDSVTSDTKGTDANDDGDTDDAGDTKPNAMEIAGIGAFGHGFDMSNADGSKHFIVFTDKMQGKDQVHGFGAEDAIRMTEMLVDGQQAQLTLGDGGSLMGVVYDHDNKEDTTDLMGSLSCRDVNDPSNCRLDTDAEGNITAISNYVFTGSRPAREEVKAADAMDDDNDYLIFGLWSAEDGSSGDDTFGAFAQGGDAATVATEVKGTATYEGSAVGAHHITGGPVSWFDGDAMLTADFDQDFIEGEISDIRVDGGDPLADSIHLSRADLGNNVKGGFGSTAEMGTMQPHLGTWTGIFYGGTKDDPDTADVNESHVAPGSIAGTFGVTRDTGMGDDVVTESFVGSFGAHKTMN